MEDTNLYIIQLVPTIMLVLVQGQERLDLKPISLHLVDSVHFLDKEFASVETDDVQVYSFYKAHYISY